MQISTVPAVFFRAVIDAAVARGCDEEHLLQQLDLAPELLAQERALLPAERFAALTETIAGDIDDEFCGLAATAVKPGTFAMMCYACIHCPTLGGYLERCAQFMAIVSEAFRLEVHREGDTAYLVFTPHSQAQDPRHVLTMVALAICQRLSNWLTGKPLALEAVTLAHPRPQYAASYNLLFKSPVQFDQPLNSLRFSANLLELPVKQDVRALETFLQTPGMQLMASPPSTDSHAARITDLISDAVATEFPDFSWVASQMHTTTGTLRRRLRQEGTSYQQLKDDIRRDTAIYNLLKGVHSIEAVAASVGFSEPTSFFRAFRRWTGVTPRAYVEGYHSGHNAAC